MLKQLFSNRFTKTNIALEAMLSKLELIYPNDKTNSENIRSTPASKVIHQMDEPKKQSIIARNNIATWIYRLSSANTFTNPPIYIIVWIIIGWCKALDIIRQEIKNKTKQKYIGLYAYGAWLQYQLYNLLRT